MGVGKIPPPAFFQQDSLKMPKLQHIIILISLLLLPQLNGVHLTATLNSTLNQVDEQREHCTTINPTNSPALHHDTNINDNLRHQPATHGPRLKRRLKSSKLPEFSAPIGNVTAVEGRDVRLICTVENLGQYQVAWLKEESKTILSIDTNIIITNYRIFLIPDEEERKWVLHIKDVQESDRGFYQCQVNTNPMRSTSGFLEVVVPPTIIESQSTRVAEVIEHSDVSLQCKANGHPKPTVSWRRDDGSPIRLNGGSINEGFPASNQTSSPLSQYSLGNQNSTVVERQTTGNSLSQLTDVKSDKLSMKGVDRFMAGIYVCTAWNGIPSQVSKRIPLYVKFPPKTSVTNKYVSVSLGQELEIDCIIEAFPKANSYWSKKPLHDDRGLWVDRARWMHLSGNAERATLYRAKQTSDESDETTTHSFEDIAKNQHSAANQSSTLRGSSEGNTIVDGKRDFIHSPGGSLRRSTSYPPSSSSSSSTRHDQTSSSIDQAISTTPPPSQPSLSTKAYVTVKQTPVNTFTYRLKLSIAQMQLDDYGEYTCISTNVLGVSESKVIVTKADKISEISDRQSSDYRSLGEDDYERDTGTDQARPTILQSANHLHQSSVRRGSAYGGNRVVYDGNYLQAIKTRQSNLVGASRLQQQQQQQQQQNLKLRQFSDRNSASSHLVSIWHISVIVLLALTMLAN